MSITLEKRKKNVCSIIFELYKDNHYFTVNSLICSTGLVHYIMNACNDVEIIKIITNHKLDIHQFSEVNFFEDDLDKQILKDLKNQIDFMNLYVHK